MESLYKKLSDLQAALFVLYHKTWVYHWHVVGPNFKQMHELFGEQKDSLDEEVDAVSEHIRFLGAKPLSSLRRVVEVSRVDEAKPQISALEMVRDLLEDHRKIEALLTEASKEAEMLGSKGTVNLLDGFNTDHGKHIWFLRSFLE